MCCSAKNASYPIILRRSSIGLSFVLRYFPMYWPSIVQVDLIGMQMKREKSSTVYYEMKVASVNNSPSSIVSTPFMLTVIESFCLGEYYLTGLSARRFSLSG